MTADLVGDNLTAGQKSRLFVAKRKRERVSQATSE